MEEVGGEGEGDGGMKKKGVRGRGHCDAIAVRGRSRGGTHQQQSPFPQITIGPLLKKRPPWSQSTSQQNLDMKLLASLVLGVLPTAFGWGNGK